MTNISFIHPGSRSLQRFADGDAPAREHSRIASHLTDCLSCRAKVSFTRDVSAKARSLPIPDPPADLISRVIAERGSGQRAILPVAEERDRSRRVAIPLIAAIALIAVTGIGVLYVRGARLENRRVSVGESPTDSISRVREFFGATIFLPDAANAAEPSTRVARFNRPAEFDGRKLRPVTLEYERQWTPRSGPKKVTAHGFLRISRAAAGDAWKVERDWTGTPDDSGVGQVRHEIETTLVSHRDLKLISRDIQVTPYLRYSRINVAQRFSGDSVVGRMTTEGGDSRGAGRPIAQVLSANFSPFINDAIAPVLLRAVALHASWTGSFSIVGWAVRNEDTLFPLTLRVIGSERITVPAGTFDCWKMSITVQRHDITTWVRKSDGVGILTRDDSRRATAGVREIVLVTDKTSTR